MVGRCHKCARCLLWVSTMHQSSDSNCTFACALFFLPCHHHPLPQHDVTTSRTSFPKVVQYMPNDIVVTPAELHDSERVGQEDAHSTQIKAA